MYQNIIDLDIIINVQLFKPTNRDEVLWHALPNVELIYTQDDAHRNCLAALKRKIKWNLLIKAQKKFVSHMSDTLHQGCNLEGKKT